MIQRKGVGVVGVESGCHGQSGMGDLDCARGLLHSSDGWRQWSLLL
jgi:hypothetical protein